MADAEVLCFYWVMWWGFYVTNMTFWTIKPRVYFKATVQLAIIIYNEYKDGILDYKLQ